jgi:hypothetical protein
MGGAGQDWADNGRPGADRPGRRRRRRRWPWVLGVIVVLILIIAGVGDQIARTTAESRIAQQIQSSGLSAKPAVNIEGWPFLTQVASRDIGTIKISADNVTTKGGKLPVNFTATATGVHPDSSFNSATVDNINGQATITYQALSSYLASSIGLPGVSALTFTPDPSQGPNVVKASAGGLGTVDATVTKTNQNTITITFGKLTGLASLAGGSIQPQVIAIPNLPAGLTIGNPTVNSTGVVIPATASHTTLS